MEIVHGIYFLVAIIYVMYSINKYFITPNLIFVMSQMMMFFGISYYIDYEIKADRMLIWMYFLALICFIISSSFFYTKYKLAYKQVKISDENMLTTTQRQVIWLMIFVSILACCYLFVSGGGNVFLQSFSALIGGDNYSTKVGRKNLLGISGVGYIYQFRTIILPILTVYMINAGNKKEKWIAKIIFPLMIIFILGTGQRGGFVMFVLMWGTALLFLYKYYGEGNLKKIFLLGVLFFMIFSLTTILNGRVSEDGNVIDAMLTRFINDNQACAVYGMRYIVTQPIQWGADWFSQIRDILPGKNDYQALSVKIFAVLNGGSTAGTSPACIWGSAFYNWGWFGVTVFPVVLAHFYSYIYKCFLSKPLNKIRIFIYAAAFIVLGMWIADGPTVLFNQGFVTIILMLWIITISKRIVFIRR